MEMTNDVNSFNIVSYEPEDWIGKFFFDDFSGTFYFQSTVTEAEQREIISRLLDRLGITNLNSQELKTVYNARNASRIFKGLEGNSFKAFSISDKRYTINKLKQGE